MNRKNSSSLDQVQTVQILLPGDLPLLLRHLSDPGCESNSHKAVVIQLDGSNDGDHLASTCQEKWQSMAFPDVAGGDDSHFQLRPSATFSPHSHLAHFAVSGTAGNIHHPLALSYLLFFILQMPFDITVAS